ncbi:hypothetical protein [Paenibacillus antibioticophila]|nr:hypothetical protein [Paenibacillus antibioticophila]
MNSVALASGQAPESRGTAYTMGNEDYLGYADGRLFVVDQQNID